MALLQEWTDQVSVAVSEDSDGTDQVGALVGAPGFRTVASDALGDVDGPATLGRFGINHLFVTGAGLSQQSPAPRFSAWGASSRTGRTGRKIFGKIIDNLRKFLVGALS